MPLLRRLPSLLLTLTLRRAVGYEWQWRASSDVGIAAAATVAAGVDVACVPGKRGRAIPQRVIKNKCIHIYNTCKVL